jgi:hypothetical protein
MRRSMGIVVILLSTALPLGAQEVGLAAGPGVLIRPERQATLGYEVGLFGTVPLSPGLHVRVDGAYHRFSPWQYSGDLCAPTGCPPDRDTPTSIRNLAVAVLIQNRLVSRIYLLAGVGIYQVSESNVDGETTAGFNAGMGFYLSSHLSLNVRYHWAPKSDLARGMLPISLAWNQ